MSEPGELYGGGIRRIPPAGLYGRSVETLRMKTTRRTRRELTTSCRECYIVCIAAEIESRLACSSPCWTIIRRARRSFPPRSALDAEENGRSGKSRPDKRKRDRKEHGNSFTAVRTVSQEGPILLNSPAGGLCNSPWPLPWFSPLTWSEELPAISLVRMGDRRYGEHKGI